jgi:SAM-dependent methyltransferase
MKTPWLELPDDFGDTLQKAAIRNAVYASELVSVAVAYFDFFSWLGKSPAEYCRIRDFFGLTDRTTDVMLTLFSAMGLVEKRQNVFRVTENAPDILESLSPWFLDRDSFTERPVHGVIEEVLRTGVPAGWAKGENPWKQMMESETFARKFLKTMDSQGLHLAPALSACLDLKDHHRLLDIAGGSGVYACHIQQRHPHLTATVLEKHPVDIVTAEYIAERGCSESVNVAQGDMLTDALPEGYDLHLWSNALHDWDSSTVNQLIGKSYSALRPGGMIVIHDSHVNRGKTGPLPIANYSVFLMTSTEGKCYSVTEIEEFLAGAGFTNVTCRDTALTHSVITAFT